MVEFKDDGTATTPASRGRTVTPSPRVVADLVAVELDDAG